MQQFLGLAVLIFLQSCSNVQPKNFVNKSPDSSMHLSRSKIPSVAPSTDRLEIEFNLSDYQWQYRVVLIFAPSEQSLTYQRQMEQWKAAEGIQERDLKLVEVMGTGAGQTDGQRISTKSTELLRQQFNIKTEDFAVILVGKDGSEKQRSQVSVDPATIFQAIDAMPMRQQEMRDRQ